ncbi:TetR/AcrR family transcriptional regulator [Rhizobium sp. C1]|uniref:TetR/AcrR family transcriptional regulator n=1 Tax=Rhizobium sp. C1 TaxID=1349799 RepID=UPI001E62A368|nr:TetR/AcrR family transcriptional regulator [Rhizobium sp. C1]MCD2179322.1 TetR/AcrR family transcriptional regulator [Rhizobium sp. C1]
MTKDTEPKTRQRAAKARRPTHARATANFEKLLQAAADVLADVGFERLTSNEICARAGLTPPAFYHYFNNKYEVLEELADRLVRKQHESFSAWFAEFSENGGRLPSAEALEKLFEAAVRIPAQEPSGMWTIRALRALPNLAHVRLKWQRVYTDQIMEAARQLAPDVSPETLWTRVRIVVEFAYIVGELAIEEDRIPQETLFRQVGLMFGGILEKVVLPET